MTRPRDYSRRRAQYRRIESITRARRTGLGMDCQPHPVFVRAQGKLRRASLAPEAESLTDLARSHESTANTAISIKQQLPEKRYPVRACDRIGIRRTEDSGR